jgi:3-phenylpropionate/cinnamic acid dioxygenase small subunit
VVLDAMDLISIHQLVGRYGHLLDLQDWEAFALLWVPDATIDYHGSTSRTQRQGRESIVEWFREPAGSHPPAHHVSNIVVDERAEATGPAEVHSKFLAPFSRPDHLPRRLYGGDYHDLVVRSAADGWRFAHRRCVPRWQLTVQVDESGPPHRRTW